ncbi:MAG: YraN family protein [Deltaproteobacteria bacterium]|nr:YraN family protein [Deltaproteobacteria bacterium]
MTRAGYRIEARNWRGGRGELDRVARHGEVLVFIEIRSRKSAAHGRPSETVRSPKQRLVISAAIAYLSTLAPGTIPPVRFDVVSILDGEEEGAAPEIEIIPGAFDAASAYRGRSIPMV